MKREEVESKYKWHLEDIFATDAEYNAELEQFKGSYKQIEAFKGKLGDKAKLLECLRLYDKLESSIARLYTYSHMRKDEDGRNDLYAGMSLSTGSLLSDFSSASAFVSSEISSQSEDYLAQIAADNDFKDFDFNLSEIIRSKKHILSPKEEKLLSMSQKPINGIRDAFTAMHVMDIPLPEIRVDGQKVQLTHGKYGYYIYSENQKTRKAAFEGMYGAVKKVVNTVCNLYAGSVASDNFFAEARGHKSALECALFENGVPSEVYKNLIKSIHANRKVMHEYVAFRKKALGLRSLHMYDMHVPIVPKVSMSVDYEKAYQMVLDGLKPMGTEYIDLLKQARDGGWIDVMENEGKASGAYSWGCYGTHPYVLLNYSRTAHDIFTVAHEMGHALHTYYSNKTQPHTKHGYRIFVAEVASTVNEVLLIKHLLKHEKDKQTRIYLLSYYIDMFRTTMFRQTMLAEFEMLAHEMDAKGEPLTVAALSDKYLALNKKYYGGAVRHDPNIMYEWSRIPHFYSAFYVYQYATGLVSAVNIAQKILADSSFAQVYTKKFLSAGGSDLPYNVLKGAGVDLASREPFEFAMQEFNNTLQELKREYESEN